MADIDFGSMRDEAVSAFSTALQEVETPPTEAPTTEAPPVEDKEPTPPPVEEKPRYKVKVDGVEKEVELDELLNGYSRTSVWTQRMQALADEKRAFEAAVQEAQRVVHSHLSAAQQREAQINAFFANPVNVEKWYRELTGNAQPAAPSYDPGQIITAADAERLVQSRVQQELSNVHALLQKQQMEARTYAEQVAMQKQLEFAQLQRASQNEAQLESYISGLLKEHPLVAAEDEGAVDRIAEQVLAMDPSSLEEAMQMITTVVQTREERLRNAFAELTKQQLVEREKLVTNATAPPGGLPPVAPTPKFKFGEKALTDKAAQYFMQLTGG